MNTKFQQLDKLHLEYEAMLIKEIESMIGVAFAHGWKSKQFEAGKRIRAKLRKAGSKITNEPNRKKSH